MQVLRFELDAQAETEGKKGLLLLCLSSFVCFLSLRYDETGEITGAAGDDNEREKEREPLLTTVVLAVRDARYASSPHFLLSTVPSLSFVLFLA